MASMIDFICAECKKPYQRRKGFSKIKEYNFCSRSCSSKFFIRKRYNENPYWTNRDNNNFYGRDNPNWKDGISKNNYHYKLIQKERYPEKIKARNIFYREIRSGRLKRGNCEICNQSNAEAHHEDYFKPLDVIWLCKKHHRKLHLRL